MSMLLYKIQHEPCYFYAGIIANGNQILAGVQMPNLVMVLFDADGCYREVIDKPIPDEFLLQRNGIYLVPDAVDDLVENWCNDLGYLAGTISIQAFYLADRWIGIKEFPRHFQEILDSPEEYDQEFRDSIEADMKLWKESGDFVFQWDEEYYMNREGEVESS